jgi:hypothetical protein
MHTCLVSLAFLPSFLHAFIPSFISAFLHSFLLYQGANAYPDPAVPGSQCIPGQFIRCQIKAQHNSCQGASAFLLKDHVMFVSFVLDVVSYRYDRLIIRAHT